MYTPTQNSISPCIYPFSGKQGLKQACQFLSVIIVSI